MANPFRLAIVRHGKAQADAPTGRDEDRDLKPRGERQAKALGEDLPAYFEREPRIVASVAVRARRTAEFIAAGFDLALDHDDRLFIDSHADAVRSLITEHVERDPGEPLIVVGHNPTLSQLAGFLLRGPGGSAELKTGQAIVLDLPVDDPAGAGLASVVASLRHPD